MSLLPPPPVLGLPAKFTHWRHHQARAVGDSLSCTKRFFAANQPTGSGKTLSNVAPHFLTGERTAYLTATKILSDQASDDFSSVGMEDIRGMGNYPCIAQPTAQGPLALYKERNIPGLMCDEGPCLTGWQCPERNSGCEYYSALRTVTRSNLFTSNYSYWLHQHKYGDGLGNIGRLVCDEAHDAPEQLASFLRVELNPLEFANRFRNYGWPAGLMRVGTVSAQIRAWARKMVTVGQEVLSEALAGQHGPIEAKHCRRLMEKLETLGNAKGRWIAKETGDGWTFEPLWPHEYASALWQQVPKIVLTSATLTWKTLGYLGLTPETCDFREYPALFAPYRRPVYHVPCTKQRWDMSRGLWQHVVDTYDRIIAPRVGLHKGIIHSISYQRAEEIKAASRYGAYMLTHDGRSTHDAVDYFKRARPPCILVSPAVGTGHDFIGDMCRWQIVAKFPFVNVKTDPLAAARQEEDKEYQYHIAIQKLIQASGRIVRDEQDWGETFVPDDHFWVLWRYRHLAPQSFLDSVRTASDREIDVPMKPVVLPMAR